MAPLAMVLALALDAAIGWPDAVYRRIGHPVTWIGALIGRLDAAWNRADLAPATRRRRGMAASLIVIAVATGVAGAIAAILPQGPAGVVLTALLAAPLLATASLHDHVAAVARPLAAGDLRAARRAVAMIVGRDPERLDTAGVSRAAIESLAENTSDGIVAPLLWGAIFGLPGIAAYKAINTLDSMIGHRTPRHEDFGRFAAILDDVANWVPARLTGWAMALASGRPVRAAAVMLRDARLHRSPNAGWPEAAMAGALGCRLSGPRAYDRGIEDQPWLNAAAPDPAPQALDAALVLYRRTIVLTALVLLAVAVVPG